MNISLKILAFHDSLNEKSNKSKELSQSNKSKESNKSQLPNQ